MNISLAMLVFDRPLHAALSLSYALANKHADTDLNVFYSIHRHTPPPSAAMDAMLKVLESAGYLNYHYIHADKEQSCGGNVDTLMTTMGSCYKYDCFMKIDDDVLIGAGTDILMSNTLMALEDKGILMLMGQVVKQHMRMNKPFSWEVTYEGQRVVQRARKACPMETYTAVNPKMMQLLVNGGKSALCEDRKGTYMPYTRKVTGLGYKVGLVLTPHIKMQHIGLTSTIDPGAPRNWAPATSWDNPAVPIDIPHFNFDEWVTSHITDTQKEFCLSTLNTLNGSVENAERKSGIQLIINEIEKYSPGQGDVALPAYASSNLHTSGVRVVHRDGKTITKGTGTLVRRPKTVKRVLIRHPSKG